VDPAEYDMVQQVVDTYGLQSFGEYHDLYLATDVLALADCLVAFRDAFFEANGIDPLMCISAPSAAWHALLFKSRPRLSLISETNGGIQFYNDCRANIRGGLSCCFQTYAIANDPRHPDFNSLLPPTQLTYIDANALYPAMMTRFLPCGEFMDVTAEECHEGHDPHEVCQRLVREYSNSAWYGYMIVITFDVPDCQHDAWGSLAPVGRMAPSGEMLSREQRLRGLRQDCQAGGVEKLVPFLGEHREEGLHPALLRVYLSTGIRVKQIHRIWRFRQRPFFKATIEEWHTRRHQAKMNGQKVLDGTLKICSNSCFGKTIEDKSKRCKTKIATNIEDYNRYFSTPGAQPHILDNGLSEEGFLATIDLAGDKPRPVDTPVFVGWAILELAKAHIYEMYHDVIAPFYAIKTPDRPVRALMMDTDSLVLELPTGSLYDDFELMNRALEGAPNRENPLLGFDMSGTGRPASSFNGQLGAFKDETEGKVLLEHVGLQSKVYAQRFWCPDTGTESFGKKAKGIPKGFVKARLSFENYKQQMTNPRRVRVSFGKLRMKRARISFQQQIRKGLCWFSDKVYEHSFNECRPLGHHLNEEDELHEGDTLSS
jgi:hypothetical protein